MRKNGSETDRGFVQRLLDVTSPSEGGDILVLYESYFDETGDDGGFPIVAVGGYITRPDEARSLEREWAGVLAKYDLPFFHMVDCAHGTELFKGWRIEKRIEIQTALMEIIKARVEAGFVCAAPIERFDNQGGLGPPYVFCLDQCLFSLNAILKAKHKEGSDWMMSCYYEAGHKYSSRALQRFEARRNDFPKIKSLSVVDKTFSGMIQAADILVWQFAKFVKDTSMSARPPRKDFLSLMSVPSFFPHIYPYQGNNVSMWYWNSTNVSHEETARQARDLYDLSLSNADLLDRHTHTFHDWSKG